MPRCSATWVLHFVDSTDLEVCHIKRAKWNKTFKGLAAKSKSTMGWFYGFKLHLICNDKGGDYELQHKQGKCR